MRPAVALVLLAALLLPGHARADEESEKRSDRDKLLAVIHDLVPNCAWSVRSSTSSADMPACDISTRPQPRAVWSALGERFRRSSWNPEMYRAAGAWGTEFVLWALEKAGLAIRQDLSISGFPVVQVTTRLNHSGRLARCLMEKSHVPGAVYTKYIHESHNLRPGDVVFFYYGTTPGKTYTYDCATNYYPFHGSSYWSRRALYCSTQVGLVVGVTGNDLVVIKGNSGGKVRLSRIANYRSSGSRIVAFGRINRNQIDCRGL